MAAKLTASPFGYEVENTVLNPLILVLFYMLTTLLLGVALGWLVSGRSYHNQMQTFSTEIGFWKTRFEKSQFERQNHIDKIDELENKLADTKQKIAAVPTPEPSRIPG